MPGVLLLTTSTTATAGVFNNETWAERLSVDKAIQITGLQWYATGVNTGNVTVRPRVYRSSDFVMVGSATDYTYNKTTSGWQPMIPLTIQPVLLPNTDYDCGFWYGAGYAASQPAGAVISAPRTVSVVFSGVTFTFTTKGRSYIVGDSGPTGAPSTTMEMGYGIEFLIIATGQKLQMML